MDRILIIIALALGLNVPQASADAPSEATAAVVLLTVSGTINPIVNEHLRHEITRAEAEKAAAILIELDTPGGLLDATRGIVSSIVNSSLPVVVYVAPRGARATSAGVFITIAADVAAMAPETHIGAAHPVTVGGGEEQKAEKPKKGGVMDEKMVSDAAAYIRALAAERGRNAEWAERAVRESVSLTAEEAKAQNVIDLIADSRDALLKTIDGRTLKKNGKDIVIKSAGAPIVARNMSKLKQLLNLLAHPNVAYLLMTLGVYALIYEFSAPGIGLGGVFGGIALLLGLLALQVLPVNTVGLALMGLGVFLLVLELMAPTHGLLTVGGLITFGLGSFMLIDVSDNPDYPRVSLELIASTIAVSALFFGWALKAAWAARRARPKIGVESLLGRFGEVRADLSPEGLVFLDGELWTARVQEGTAAVGSKVSVIRIEGNTLIVRKTS